MTYMHTEAAIPKWDHAIGWAAFGCDRSTSVQVLVALQMHMSVAARPAAPSPSGRGRVTAGPLGWVAVVVAAAGLIWLLFGKTLSGWAARWGRGGKTGGKWVSDRSLGGKMVQLALMWEEKEH